MHRRTFLQTASACFAGLFAAVLPRKDKAAEPVSLDWHIEEYQLDECNWMVRRCRGAFTSSGSTGKDCRRLDWLVPPEGFKRYQLCYQTDKAGTVMHYDVTDVEIRKPNDR